MFCKKLHKVWGYDLEISLIGIENDNPYFSQDKDLPKAKNKVVISSAMAQKYDLKKSDRSYCLMRKMKWITHFR